MDFGRYMALFLEGDDDTFCEAMFTEDVVMEASSRVVEGRPALREFLAWAHDGVRELPRPQIVVQTEKNILAEIDMDFFALRDRPDFLIKPMRRGETVTCKFFAVYTLRGDRVCRLKTSYWPAGHLVSPAPDYRHLLAQTA